MEALRTSSHAAFQANSHLHRGSRYRVFCREDAVLDRIGRDGRERRPRTGIGERRGHHPRRAPFGAEQALEQRPAEAGMDRSRSRLGGEHRGLRELKRPGQPGRQHDVAQAL